MLTEISEREALVMEVGTIVDMDLRAFVFKALEKVPETFWEIPASSTGKHHPEQSNGPGGLVRHILAGLYFVRELCIPYSATQEEKDACVAAMILHDVGKAIAEPHDIVWATQLRWIAGKNDSWILQAAIAGVRWHMGPWSTGSTMCHNDEKGDKVFPDHFSRIEQIVHLADYAASRKRVNMTKLGGL
jgi:hypothetical protein